MSSKGRVSRGKLATFPETAAEFDSGGATAPELPSNLSDVVVDEASDQICDLCIEDEHYITAKVFCKECEQRLCERCHKTHQRGKITRAHESITLLDKNDDKTYLKQVTKDNKLVSKYEGSDNVRTDTKGTSQEVKMNDRHAFREKVAVHIGQIHVTVITDEDTAIVCALEVLDEERFVVCDSANNKIKMFHIEDKLLSEVALTSKPGGLVMLTATDILVSLPLEQCLQMAKTDSRNQLIMKSKANTSKRYYRLIKYQENVIVHAEDDSQKFIFVMDKNGKEVRRIITDTKGRDAVFSVVRFICISTDDNVLYVTDSKRGCIGLSMTGDVLFAYKETKTKEHWGVCTDKNGCVYLSCPDTDKIVMLNNKGEKIKDLLQKKGMDPGFMSFSKLSDSLFVWSDQVKYVLIYKLKSLDWYEGRSFNVVIWVLQGALLIPFTFRFLQPFEVFSLDGNTLFKSRNPFCKGRK